MTYFFTSIFVLLVFWRPQEWLIPGMMGWPVLDAVVGFSLLSLAVEVNEGRLKIPRDLPQIGLLVGLWISAPLSHVPHTYLLGIRESIMPIFKICFFSYLLIVVLDRIGRYRGMVALLVAMGSSLAVHAFLQIKRGYGFGRALPYWIEPIFPEPGYYRTCFFGIFNDPNDLAQLFACCMPLCFAITKRMNFITLVFSSALAWMFIKALETTHSRGGEVGMLAAVGTLIALLLPHRWFPYLVALGLLGFLAVCPFTANLLDASAHDRVVYWGLANGMFKHNPIFGIGYEMAWQVTAKGEALHNAFVTCYTELGLFGYWFWFLLIQVGMVGAWRVRGALRKQRDPDARYLRRLAGMTMASMMAFCASGYFLSRTFVFPLFFLISMLAVLPRLASAFLPVRYPPMFEKRHDLYTWGTVGVLISVIYVYLSCILLNMAYYG